MLTDGLTAQQADGTAARGVEVVDVAQMLLAAVRRGDPQPQVVGQPAPDPRLRRVLDRAVDSAAGRSTSG